MRWLSAALFAVGLGVVSVQAGAPVPAPPQYYVLDEPHVLSENTRRQIEYLLIEHDRATGDQIVLAIFDSIGTDELVSRTTDVFKEWKIGKRGKDNGILIAAYMKEHLLRLEVGYGLEPQMTDAKSKDVIEDILKPRLRAGDTDGAFLSAVQSVLTTLESPLLQNPDAAPYLQQQAMRRTRVVRTSNGGASGLWFSALFLIAILGIIVWNWIIAAEARFTRAGWSPYRKGLRRRSHALLGGMGLGGFGSSRSSGSGWGGGSGGGFSGGGGRSGGGGASGSW